MHKLTRNDGSYEKTTSITANGDSKGDVEILQPHRANQDGRHDGDEAVA